MGSQNNRLNEQFFWAPKTHVLMIEREKNTVLLWTKELRHNLNEYIEDLTWLPMFYWIY